MLDLSLAWRNVLRNRRRTLITLMTVAMGATALLLLGALMSYIVLEFQTSAVRRTGHLAVFKKGYFDYGAGNPAAYGIGDYDAVLATIRSAPGIQPYLLVATPTQIISGVAGNFQAGTSKTFFGQGIVPADRLRMRQWNEHRISGLEVNAPPLSRANGVAVGSGLGRILQLCDPRQAAGCAPRAAVRRADGGPAPVDAEAADLIQLRQREVGAAPAAAQDSQAIELLSASATGAPNVVSAVVERLDTHGSKDLDDNLVVMPLPIAQQLAYGRGAPRVTALNLQLKRTEDIPAVRAALRELIQSRGLDLEVRDFVELNAMYGQIQAFFSFLFGFIALVIVVIVVFTIMNTMGMSVMERVGEIGTARALGVQRSSVRNLFVLEGGLQGVLGATLGVLLTMLLVTLVNAANLHWSPPTSAGEIPFKLYLFGSLPLMAGVWFALTCVAALASLFPAHRASRMMIVDALRHV